MHRSFVLAAAGVLSAYAGGALAQFPIMLDGSSLPAAPWLPDGGGGSAAVVALGGGNSGIQYTDSGGGHHEHYYTHYEQASTFATRFRVDAYDPATPHNLLLLTAGNISGTSPGLVFGIRGGQYTFGEFFPARDEGTLVGNIAPVVPSEFNTVTLYLDSATDTVMLWWNGALLFNQSGIVGGWGATEGYAEFGSAAWSPDDSGALTATYDWVGFGPGLIPEPCTLVLLGMGVVLARRRR
ncbi:MAG: hypothetical protein AMXMBFR13_28590 [Phycisphaerae bacterium]